ncbi:MAG: TraR/DksA C4-type zinc finger protein [Verrucomicrobiae bacterium]|nr:TraR/DksA C4-type zinc finger protein [Verrucomicrobiae bacterium]
MSSKTSKSTKKAKKTPEPKAKAKAPKAAKKATASKKEAGAAKAPIMPHPDTLKGPHSRYIRLLLNVRDRLLDDIDFHSGDNLKRTQRDASSDLSAYSVHMADAGTDNFDREFALSMVSNEQEALYEIEEAIKRADSGSFGTCEMCAKPIPKPRLDAIPWARNCVKCQEQYEKTSHKRSIQTFQLSDFANSDEEGSEKEEED